MDRRRGCVRLRVHHLVHSNEVLMEETPRGADPEYTTRDILRRLDELENAVKDLVSCVADLIVAEANRED